MPRAASKCPYCGARRAWEDPGRGRERRRPGGWKVVAYAALAVILLVVVLAGLWMLDALKRPISSTESEARPAGAPVDCAELVAGLKSARATGQVVTPEARDRLRQCLSRP